MTPQSESTYEIGDKPGKGVYACKQCGWHISLHESEDALPPCENCDHQEDVVYIQRS